MANDRAPKYVTVELTRRSQYVTEVTV